MIAFVRDEIAASHARADNHGSVRPAMSANTGCRARVGDGVRGRDKRHRGDHDLVAGTDAGTQACEVQRGRPARRGDGVAGAGISRELLLQLRRARAHAQPPGFVGRDDGVTIGLGDDDVSERNHPVSHGATLEYASLQDRARAGLGAMSMVNQESQRELHRTP